MSCLQQSLRAKSNGYEFPGANTFFGMWLRVWFTENFHELDLVSRLPSDKLKGLREQDSGREKARPHDLLTIIKLVSS